MSEFHLIDHPLIIHKLSIMRTRWFSIKFLC